MAPTDVDSREQVRLRFSHAIDSIHTGTDGAKGTFLTMTDRLDLTRTATVMGLTSLSRSSHRRLNAKRLPETASVFSVRHFGGVHGIGPHTQRQRKVRQPGQRIPGSDPEQQGPSHWLRRSIGYLSINRVLDEYDEKGRLGIRFILQSEREVADHKIQTSMMKQMFPEAAGFDHDLVVNHFHAKQSTAAVYATSPIFWTDMVRDKARGVWQRIGDAVDCNEFLITPNLLPQQKLESVIAQVVASGLRQHAADPSKTIKSVWPEASEAIQQAINDSQERVLGKTQEVPKEIAFDFNRFKRMMGAKPQEDKPRAAFAPR